MKAQNLPISVIVAGVLVLIVVGVVMLAFGGGFSGIMSRLNLFASAQTGSDVELMTTKCRQACGQLKNSATSELDILNSEFCLLRWNTVDAGGSKGDTCLNDPDTNNLVRVSCETDFCKCINCGRNINLEGKSFCKCFGTTCTDATTESDCTSAGCSWSANACSPSP